MTLTGSLLKKGDRKKAASLIARGEVVGVFNRGVCALWFDGGSQGAVAKIEKIKGENRGKRPVALTLSLDELIPMLDLERIHPSLHECLLVVSELKSKIGSFCFIRVPIKSKFVGNIPKKAQTQEVDGTVFIQNWDPFGHDLTADLLELVKKLGVKYPAVTSMNKTGQPEIVDQAEGERFCKKEGISVFLKDPTAHPRLLGSYTIINFGMEGIKLIRDGNIPVGVIERILELPINKKGAGKPKFRQMDFPGHLFSDQAPQAIRQAILNYLKYV